MHHFIVYYNPDWWRYLLMISKQTNLEVITLAIRSYFTPTTPAMSSGHNLWYFLSILSGRTSHNGIWLAKTCVVKTTEWVDTSLHTVYIGTIVTLQKHNSISFQVSMVRNTLIHVCGCLPITHCMCTSKQENTYIQTCRTRWQVNKPRYSQWIPT